MTSLPDDFIARFGSDRDLIFFPTEEFLSWAGRRMLRAKDDEAEGTEKKNKPYFLYRLGSSPELSFEALDDGRVCFFAAGSTADDLDSAILSNAKKLEKRGKFKETFPYQTSLETGIEPKDPAAYLGASVFGKSPSGKKKSAVVRGEGTASDIIAIFDGGTAAAPTPLGLKKIAADVFNIANSDTDWFIGFASSPSGLELIESQPDWETAPNFTYWAGESSCFDVAIAGTGGEIMVGRSTGAEWFAIEEFGTAVELGTQPLLTATDLISENVTSTLMSSSTLSIYARFDFNFSSADLASGDDPIPYDHLFIYRGEGTAVDSVCQLPEPGDARLNPGARVEAIFNVSAMGILRI